MKYKLLTLLSAAAMFTACGDSSVSNINDETKETATVVITALDNLTKMPIEGVSVYYRTTDKTKTTDSTGTIAWQDVEIGDSYFDFQYEGYAFKRVKVTVKDNIANDVARVDDVLEKVMMYELGVDIKGQFFYKDVKTGNLKPAANVTIYATYADDEIYPNEVSVTTDSLGFYSFTNMASNIGIDLSSERFTLEDGTIYEAVASFATVNERKGVAKEVEAKNAVPAGNKPVLLSTNLMNIKTETAIKLTFSEELEKDSVKTFYIYVMNAASKVVATNVSLSDDGKTITVKPASGAWVDENNYKVYFEVWTKTKIKDDDPNGYREFKVGESGIPAQISNFKLDTAEIADVKQDVVINFYGEYTYAVLNDDDPTNDTINYNATINVIWDEIEKGISGYTVYVKADNEDDADYVSVQYLGKDAHKASINIAAYLFGTDEYDVPNDMPKYPFSKKQPTKVDIMVLPYNDVGEAIASKAKPITVDIKSKVEAKMKELQSSKYVTTVGAEIYTALYCTDEDFSSCNPGADAADMNNAGYYNLDVHVTWKVDNEEEATSTFDVYYASKSGYVYLGRSTSSDPNVYMWGDSDVLKGTPFYKEDGVSLALKYKASDDKTYKFVVIPLYETSDYTIGATDIKSSAGVVSGSTDMQDLIDDL